MADCNDHDMTNSSTSSSSECDDSWADFGEEIDMTVHHSKQLQKTSLLPSTSSLPNVLPNVGTSGPQSVKTANSEVTGKNTASSGGTKSVGFGPSSKSVASYSLTSAPSSLPSTSGHHKAIVSVSQTIVHSVVPKMAKTKLPNNAEYMEPMRRAWDPLASSGKAGDALSIHATNRIKKDLAAFSADPPENISICNDDSDLRLVYALIIGPEDTPYEGGFFHFILRFPTDYPFAPPLVRIMTTDGGQVRFNPNLYADGKVCLSILGTWAGPPWSSAQSLTSVLLSIQSLMCAKPFYNEPGYENFDYEEQSKVYNLQIAYQTLRVAVCQALENPQGVPDSLVGVMQQKFQDYYVNYRINATKLMEHNNKPLHNPYFYASMKQVSPASLVQDNIVSTVSIGHGKPKPHPANFVVQAKPTTHADVAAKPTIHTDANPSSSGLLSIPNKSINPSLNTKSEPGPAVEPMISGASSMKKKINYKASGQYFINNSTRGGVVFKIDELVERLKALWLKISGEPEPWDI